MKTKRDNFVNAAHRLAEAVTDYRNIRNDTDRRYAKFGCGHSAYPARRFHRRSARRRTPHAALALGIAGYSACQHRAYIEVSARTGEAFVPSTYKQPFVDVNTYELTYVSLVEGHLIPYFGAARLNDIRPADIQAYFATRTECLESRLKK